MPRPQSQRAARLFRRTLALAIVCLLAAPAGAQDKKTPSPTPRSGPRRPPPAKTLELKAEAIAARIKTVEESKELDEAARAAIRAIYLQVLDQIKLADEQTAAAERHTRWKDEWPKEVERIKADLAKPPDETPVVPPKDATLAILEQGLAAAEAEFVKAKEDLAERDAEPRRRADRRQEIPKLVEAAKATIAAANQELDAPAPEKEAAEMTLARRTLALAKRTAAELEIKACEIEIARYDVDGELVTARRDRGARAVALAERLAQAWRDLVAESRRKEAEQDVLRAEEARRAAINAHPAIREFFQATADEAAALAAERSAPADAEKPGLAARIERARQDLSQATAESARVQDDFKKVKDRVKAAGLSNAVGLQLRGQRGKLPNIRALRRQIAARQQEIGEIELRRIELDEARSETPDAEAQIRSTLSALGASVAEERRGEIEKALRDVLETRRKLADGLIDDYRVYSETLAKLDERQRELAGQSSMFADYIGENVLWIRSAPVIRPTNLPQAGRSLLWLLAPEHWRGVAEGFRGEIKRNLPLQLAALLLFALWIGRQKRLRRRLHEIGEFVMKKRGDTIADTWRALGLTALIAGLWPSFLAFHGWRLATADPTDFAHAVGNALIGVAFFFFSGEFFRQACRPLGLGEAHFNWPAPALKIPRRHLAWFMAIALPMAGIVGALEAREVDAWKDPLGRIAFMVAMGAMAEFTFKLFRMQGGVLEEYHARNAGTWPDRLRPAWLALAVGLPGSLLLGAAFGYYYTSATLAWRLVATAWLLMGLLVAYSFISRWLLLARRRLAIEQARKRVAAMKAEAKGESASSGDTGQILAAAPDIDLTAVDKQTRNLLRTAIAAGVAIGLWLVWVDVLPALNVLDRIGLWTASVNGRAVPVTVADALLAIATVAITYIGASNLPGLLEIAILQRLNFDAGARYAFKAICAYAISIAGIVLAFGEIGIGWSDVQWLAAAVTVGLGFGLQEIFANFVSGMIILFERPVRVGDVVTVGDITGTVSRIHMRSTRIIDGENRALIVPNKDLITGRVVNLTLTDTTVRVVIPVGVAYGSDVALVERLLLEAARDHALILASPEPRAVLGAFGPNALEFKLYAFHQRRENGQKILHELNAAIERAFRASGIQVAAPQLDVRIKREPPKPPATSE